MDPRERHEEHEEALAAMLDGFQARVWTALPGIVQSFDATKLTAEVQIAIQGQVQDKQGNWSNVNMPLLVDCPVLFPNAGGFALTFPIKADDECLVIFASRNIDSWWQNGGVQPPARFRMHDLSDGFVLPGARSQANLLPNYDAAKLQLRNEAGDCLIEMSAGKVVTITAPGGINLNGVTIDSSGNVAGVGTLDASGEGTFNNHTVGAHTHGGVQTGGGTTDPPSG